MKPFQLKQLTNLCFFLGFASILGSIAIWFLTGAQPAETQAHAGRFGIFVGLWAPTFSSWRTVSTASRKRPDLVHAVNADQIPDRIYPPSLG